MAISMMPTSSWLGMRMCSLTGGFASLTHPFFSLRTIFVSIERIFRGASAIRSSPRCGTITSRHAKGK